MGVLGKLDTKHLSNLPEIIEYYDNKLAGWKEKVKIDGKNIEAANIEQASWLAYYDEIKVELKTLNDFMYMKVCAIRGMVLKMVLKNESERHNQITRDSLIDCDPDFIKFNTLYMEVHELYSMAEMIVKGFIQRGFTLKNLVAIRVAALQDVTLFIDDDL